MMETPPTPPKKSRLTAVILLLIVLAFMALFYYVVYKELTQGPQKPQRRSDGGVHFGHYASNYQASSPCQS
jgi:hypothetical protein